MPSRDLHSSATPLVAYNITSLSGGAATSDGNIIDTFGYEGCEFVPVAGTITTGGITPFLFAGAASDLSDGATVSATDLLGSFANFGDAADNTAQHVGYTGAKRYARLSYTRGASCNGTFGAVCILGHKRHGPTS